MVIKVGLIPLQNTKKIKRYSSQEGDKTHIYVYIDNARIKFNVIEDVIVLESWEIVPTIIETYNLSEIVTASDDYTANTATRKYLRYKETTHIQERFNPSYITGTSIRVYNYLRINLIDSTHSTDTEYREFTGRETVELVEEAVANDSVTKRIIDLYTYNIVDTTEETDEITQVIKEVVRIIQSDTTHAKEINVPDGPDPDDPSKTLRIYTFDDDHTFLADAVMFGIPVEEIETENTNTADDYILITATEFTTTYLGQSANTNTSIYNTRTEIATSLRTGTQIYNTTETIRQPLVISNITT